MLKLRATYDLSGDFDESRRFLTIAEQQRLRPKGRWRPVEESPRPIHFRVLLSKRPVGYHEAMGRPEMHIEVLDAPSDPSGAFRAVAGPGCAFLDGRGGAPELARYSFLCGEPFATLETKGEDQRLTVEGRTLLLTGSPFDALRSLLRTFRAAPQPTPFPFVGGAIGYLGYDLVHFVERLPRKASDDLRVPDLWLSVYDAVLVFDAAGAGVLLVRWTGLDGQDANRAAERSAQLRRAATGDAAPAASFPAASAPASSFTREGYLAAVRRAKEYIAAGDIYQVNLSQRLSFHTTALGPDLFLRIGEHSPAPFSAYIDTGPFQVLSSSPERFLMVDGRRVETRPIKGTRPRGRNPEEDRRLAEELARSEKDNAELAMIVDLERNDLGRVCDFGTVRVVRARGIETFSTVHHLVATVEGTLSEGKDVVDLLQATFPGGSITGCPKIRAMEIIDELEPVRRGVYTGAIGYFGMDGRTDLSIAIRLAVLKDGVAYVSVGGGIVADSDPEAEYEETMAKAAAWRQALEGSGR